jgi:hypothetical protein
MNERFYFTYIIASRSRTLYVGVPATCTDASFSTSRRHIPDSPRDTTATVSSGLGVSAK